MKKLIILLLAALTFESAHAQVPGYQGKRFAVGVNTSSFVYVTDLTFGDIIFSMKFAYKTEGYVNYTLSRKVVAGFSYYYAKQKDYFNNEYYYSNGYRPVDYVPCKISMYEFHLQFFRKNFVAPAGLYHQFGFALVNYGAATDSVKMEDGYHYKRYVKTPTEMYSCMKLSYHIGKTNPIGHHMYINTAVGINFFRGGDAVGLTTNNDQYYFQRNFNHNLRTHNFAEIKIGLGWLAF